MPYGVSTVHVKLDVSCHQWTTCQVKSVAFIGYIHFEWHSQNNILNIGILVLWKVCENAYVSWIAVDLVNRMLSDRAVNWPLCQEVVTTHKKIVVENWI